MAVVKIPLLDITEVRWDGVLEFNHDKLDKLRALDVVWGVAPGALSNAGEAVLTFDGLQGVYIKILSSTGERLVWVAEWRWYLDTAVKRFTEAPPEKVVLVVDTEKRAVTYELS